MYFDPAEGRSTFIARRFHTCGTIVARFRYRSLNKLYVAMAAHFEMECAAVVFVVFGPEQLAYRIKRPGLRTSRGII